MQITTCPKCGCKSFLEKLISDLVLNTCRSTYICKDCGFQGSPLVIEQYEGTFLGIKSSVPGFIGPWEIKTRLDNGEKKVIEVLWEDARDCIKSLKLKKGDKIKITIDEKLWCLEKILL